MPKTWSRSALLAGATAAMMASAAFAADPKGEWLTEDHEARIRIHQCGGALCGSIAALREPMDPATRRPKTDAHNHNPRLRGRPLIGVQIVVGMRPDAPGKWVGHVYNPDDGGLYPATLTLRNARTLRVEGCMLPGALCSGQTWVRLH
jgi:uncharacterized protein (DUF2147 family)